MDDARRLRLAEHHVELGETEDESLTTVDEGQIERVAELPGQRGGELKPAEARTEYDDPHVAIIHPRARDTGPITKLRRQLLTKGATCAVAPTGGATVQEDCS
jgi:hypothetical protein